jgi:hypothetical protein
MRRQKLSRFRVDHRVHFIQTDAMANVLDEKRGELEHYEFMMGAERGRLAVALDLLTDALVLVGQHGVYCASTRNPTKPALDLQAVLGGVEGAKELIQTVMESLRAQREAAGATASSAAR